MGEGGQGTLGLGQSLQWQLLPVLLLRLWGAGAGAVGRKELAALALLQVEHLALQLVSLTNRGTHSQSHFHRHTNRGGKHLGAN